MDFKLLVEELKEFYEVKSLEAVAEKMGYAKKTAATWRQNKTLSAKAMLKYQQDKAQALPSLKTHISHDNLTVKIPVYDVCASAGAGLINDENISSFSIVDKRFLRDHFRLADFTKLSIIRAKGDSMFPTIPPNALLLIQETRVNDGQICVVRIHEELYVKRLQKLPYLKLISDNDQYDPIILKDLDYAIVGLVVGMFYQL